MFGGGGDVIRAMASGARADRRGRLGPIASAMSPGAAVELSGSSTTSPTPRRWWRATARHQQHRGPQGQEDRRAVHLDRRTSTLVALEIGQASNPADVQRHEHASAGDRGGLGARRHRRHVHLGSGARQDQGQRQGDRSPPGKIGKDTGKADLRRHRRQTGVGQGATPTSWSSSSRRSPRPTRTIARTPPSGRRTRRRSRRWPSGPAPSPKDVPAGMALYTLPDDRRAGQPDVARRRREERRGGLAGSHRGVPEGAGHDPERPARLLGVRESVVRASGGEVVPISLSPTRGRPGRGLASVASPPSPCRGEGVQPIQLPAGIA